MDVLQNAGDATPLPSPGQESPVRRGNDRFALTGTSASGRNRSSNETRFSLV